MVTRTDTHIHACMHMHTPIHRHAHTYTDTHAQMYVHTHARTHNTHTHQYKADSLSGFIHILLNVGLYCFNIFYQKTIQQNNIYNKIHYNTAICDGHNKFNNNKTDITNKTKQLAEGTNLLTAINLILTYTDTKFCGINFCIILMFFVDGVSKHFIHCEHINENLQSYVSSHAVSSKLKYCQDAHDINHKVHNTSVQVFIY